VLKLISVSIKARRKLNFFRKYKNIIDGKIIKEWDDFLLHILHWANRKHNDIIEKKLGIDCIDNPSNYESLIPSEDADKNKKYSEALKIALQTPKVNNIAITGPYGSGKSSFLRTFEKNNSEWIYLPISLATFKDDELIQNALFNNTTTNESTIIVNSDDKTKDTKYEINQLIEKSILQQIFYREEERNIPSSRFKRIKNIKPYRLGLHVSLLVLLSVLGVFLYAPNYYKALFLISELPKLNESVLLGSFFIGTIYFIYQLSKYLMNLQVSKLNLKDGEIELGNKEKTSILNEHLDEILYFFEVTSYNVVVLEDLDRFGNTEIFIKLRELNTLINNSKEIGRRVVFIYAIKDEMFKDKDRTKFFDFILPIIPYINPSNSLEKIKLKFKEETTIDQDFLSDIALYIDDMRLLVNIYNEYMIYKHKLTSDKLDKNKLLAMIIYKNLYPSDFAKLHFNDGVVYELINNKSNLIQIQIDKKRKFIGNIDAKIQNIKNEIVENITELKMIYLCKLGSQLSATHFKIDGSEKYYTFEDLLNGNCFKTLIQSDNISGYIYLNAYRHVQTTQFSVIENEINKEYSYEERTQFIENRSNELIEKLREDIEKLENEIDIVKSFTLQKLVQNSNEDIFGQDFVDRDILKLLIRDGYIDENYHDYISYFFEGSITLNDREFLLSVKNNHSLEYTFRLNKIDELIKRLKSQDFETSAILNFDLTMYLLDNSQLANSFLKKLLLKLSDESDESIKFILELINHLDNAHRKKYAPILWNKFWEYIIKKSDFSEKKKEEYFDFLFQNLEVEKLIEFNVDNTLKEYIENKDQLSTFDVIQNEKYERLYKALDIKYRFISNQRDNLSLFRSIYENNHYQINVDMVNKMVLLNTGQEKEFEEKLKHGHFTILREPNLPLRKLREYIDENINEYIQNVFLKIETNTQESEETLIELLKHATISSENKIAIIQKEEIKIIDISKVSEDKTIWKELLKANKIEPNWDNLLYYYQQSDEFDDVLIDFFNQEENYIELSKRKLKNEEIFGEEILKKFTREILLSNAILDKAYELLVKGVWYWNYKSLAFDDLSMYKIEVLLKNKIIGLTPSNYLKLKAYLPNQAIILLEKFKTDFFEKIEDFTLNDNDYLEMMKSSEFSMDEKIALLEKINLALFDNQQLVDIAIDIHENSPKKMPIELFDKLFEKSNFEDALRLLISQITHLEDQQIVDCLIQLGEPYIDLTEKSAKVLKLENNQLNEKLIELMKVKKLISSFSADDKKIKINRFVK